MLEEDTVSNCKDRNTYVYHYDITLHHVFEEGAVQHKDRHHVLRNVTMVN
jgi:hypothetical protein